MNNPEPKGAVHWIDHYVVGTNDMAALELLGGQRHRSARSGRSIGLTTNTRKKNIKIFCFMWWEGGSCRIGAFLQPENYPPAKELGKDLPRCGFYIRPEDIDDHLRRLDQHKIPHSDPIKTAADGEEGTVDLFRRSGRQSIRVLGAGPDARRRHGDRHDGKSRPHQPRRLRLARSGANRGVLREVLWHGRWSEIRKPPKAHWCCACAPAPVSSTSWWISSTNASPATALGGTCTPRSRCAKRNSFRTTGVCGTGSPKRKALKKLSTIHATRKITFLRAPVCTAARSAIKWKEIYQRGDEFYDWDGHAFHFIGGIPLAADNSMALYEGIEQEEYLLELAQTINKEDQPDLMKGLGKDNPFNI